jgi:hypothetical protein
LNKGIAGLISTFLAEGLDCLMPTTLAKIITKKFGNSNSRDVQRPHDATRAVVMENALMCYNDSNCASPDHPNFPASSKFQNNASLNLSLQEKSRRESIGCWFAARNI